MPAKKLTSKEVARFSQVFALGPRGAARVTASLAKNKLPLGADTLASMALHNHGRLTAAPIARYAQAAGVAHPDACASELLNTLPGVHRLNKQGEHELDVTLNDDFLKTQDNALRPTPRPGAGVVLTQEELEQANPPSPIAQLRPTPAAPSDMVQIGEAIIKTMYRIPKPGDIPTLIPK